MESLTVTVLCLCLFSLSLWNSSAAKFGPVLLREGSHVMVESCKVLPCSAVYHHVQQYPGFFFAYKYRKARFFYGARDHSSDDIRSLLFVRMYFEIFLFYFHFTMVIIGMHLESGCSAVSLHVRKLAAFESLVYELFPLFAFQAWWG